MGFVDFMLEYGVTILSILGTVITLIISFVKAKKRGNSVGMIALLEKIPSLVTTAESLFGNGRGSAKLDYVLTQLRLYALQNGIKVDAEDLTAQINSVVHTTNNVNIGKPTPSQDSTAGASYEDSQNSTQDTINV